MNNSLLDTAVVPIQKLENTKPSNAMINTGQPQPLSFNYGGSVAPPEVQLAEPPPINLAFGGMPNVPVVPVAKTVEATTYSGDTVGEGIANFVDNDPILTPNSVLEREPKVTPFDMMLMNPEYPVERFIEPMKNMDPQLRMILQAQMDKNGINQMIVDSPIAKLKSKQYTDI
jgi:hypothetical protein